LSPVERFHDLLLESIAVFVVLLVTAVIIVTAILLLSLLLEYARLEKRRDWPSLRLFLLSPRPLF
jgi:hypothetical protein